MNEIIEMRPRRRMRSADVRHWAIAVTAVALAVAGCDSGPEPVTTPEPSVTYGQVTGDLCERAKMAEIVARFGLKPRSEYEPTVRFDNSVDHDYLSCAVRAYEDGERFRTPLGEFDPGGTIILRTYSDHGAVEGDHELEVSQLKSLEQSRPGTSTKAVDGWWDDGLYVQMIEPISPGQYPRLEGLDAAWVQVVYELRHGNLLVTSRLDTHAATPQIEEVLALLRNLVNALTEEAVSQLSRTGPD